MKITNIFIAFIILLPQIILSQWETETIKLPQSFVSLKNLSTNNLYMKGDNAKLAIHFNPNLCTVINQLVKPGHPIYDEYNTNMELISIHFPDIIGPEYRIVFDWGLSADPTFWIFKFENNTYTKIGGASALQFYWTGGNYCYSTGHTNRFFNMHHKWKFDGVEFVEVDQAFYYVVLKTKNTEPITLYSDEKLTKEIAHLPANAEIEVVLYNDKKYLIKTSFGLLGWFYFGNSSLRCYEIPDIWFAGGLIF